MRPPLLLPTVACLLAAACGDGPGGGEAVADTLASVPPAGVVDSVLPMDVMLDRFRAGVAEPDGLAGGADSRDELVLQAVRALEAADTLAFERLGVSLAEWAWLYFPNSVQARPPYELPPALAWFQLQEGNRQGVLRLLSRLGGTALDYRGYRCDPEPTQDGGIRVWVGCLVTVARPGEEPADVRLFSAILERDGRLAILSWVNDF